MRLCLKSIRAQCFGPLMRERRRRLNSAKSLPAFHTPALDDVETLAGHVTRFSLAGIRAVKDPVEMPRE